MLDSLVDEISKGDIKGYSKGYLSRYFRMNGYMFLK